MRKYSYLLCSRNQIRQFLTVKITICQWRYYIHCIHRILVTEKSQIQIIKLNFSVLKISQADINYCVSFFDVFSWVRHGPCIRLTIISLIILSNFSKNNEKSSKCLQFIAQTENLKISLNKLMFPLCLIVIWYGYHMSMFSKCQTEIRLWALDFFNVNER